VLQALQHYGSLAGPYQSRAAELHQELRRNLVQNIVKEYDRTGYLWEQYDDITGAVSLRVCAVLGPAALGPFAATNTSCDVTTSNALALCRSG
jgi:hypothetical protein